MMGVDLSWPAVLTLNGAVPLLAALDAGTLELLFIIAAFTYFAISNLLKVAKGQPRKTIRPAPPPRPRPQPGRQAVDDEVSEFLRRAAEKRAARNVAEAPRNEPPRRLVEIGADDVVEVQAIDEPPTGAAVAQHVQQHLDTREFAARASHLTNVDQSDVTIKSHLQQVFTHPVGHLASRGPEKTEGQSGAAATAPGVPVASDFLASLLGDPQSLRGAVVLNEVLQRPTDRW
ncbi:MAG TPA: hypothetical protein VGX76_15600 [Pirellulales bacterium]|jgi:hypothetical protein|nr:hypothetical protein [Pirellulales bacterium]